MVGELMKLIIIICIVVAIVASILIFLITIYNKFQWLIIKLDKGENNIASSLEVKYNILLRYIEFLKNNTTIDEEDFEEYKLLNTKIPVIKFNKKINELTNMINTYMDNNEKLYKNETVNKLNEEIYNINLSINSSKKYYNNHLTEYNHLCNAFPSKIIANIFKYKEKEFIDEETPNTLKILNQDIES